MVGSVVGVRRLRSDDDFDAVAAVGVRAGERFRGVADPRVARCADDPPIGLDVLARYASTGWGWVAVADTTIVGFVLVDLVDEAAHVEEVAVDPSTQGQGVGTALLDAVDVAAGEAGLASVTLTTFATVAWNQPFYERRGFGVVAPAELTPGLRARVSEEAAHGLDPTIRVVMRRLLAATAG